MDTESKAVVSGGTGIKEIQSIFSVTLYSIYSIKISNYYVIHLKLIQYCKSTKL